MVRRVRRHGRCEGRDQGFLLAEVVVAMSLFAILVVAALGILVRTTSLAGQNLRRTAAANLLTRQLEAAQAVRALDIPAGTRTTSVTVGSIAYSVAQEVRYVSSADGTSLCDTSAGSLLYKLVTVRVTWPDMSDIPPVRGDVLRALGIGSEGSDAARGALAVTVRNPQWAPVAGATVVLPNGATQTTDAQGCVVFVDLPPGAYWAYASTDGGHTNGYSSGATVQPGGIARTTVVIYPPPPPPPPAPTPSPTPTPTTTATTAPVPTPTPTDAGGGGTPTDTSTSDPTPSPEAPATSGSGSTGPTTPSGSTETATTPPFESPAPAPAPSPSPSPPHKKTAS